MNALVFHKSIPRYVLLKVLGRRFRSVYTSAASPLRFEDVRPPPLPSPTWVRIAPTLSGICGSDLATVCAKGTPYLAPVTSMPFVMGHELVGRVTEIGVDVKRVKVGERVVLRPALGCQARGISPLCDRCVVGQDALCRNVTRGVISPGLQTGFCRDTGGGFGESLVAHESQAYGIPNELPDPAAVLIEPFACAIHAALRATAAPGETVLVIGCGAIGLLLIAALRATGCRARIIAVAKYDHQREAALAFGADALLDSRGAHRERYPLWAKELGAELLKAELGKPAVVGGADVVYDCVASSQSIDDGMRFTRSGGTYVLVGMPGMPWGVDWTPPWYKELSIRAAYAYGREQTPTGERDTFDIAIELMRGWGETLTRLVGGFFALRDYRSAFAAAIRTGRCRWSKTVFALEPKGESH